MSRLKQLKPVMDVFAFADELSYFNAKRKAYSELLPSYGQELAKAIYGPAGQMTLREAARRSGLSPTYLSLVVSGKTTISIGAYIALADIIRKKQ